MLTSTGEPIVGDTILLMFNADHANTISFTVSTPENGDPWELLFDTARPDSAVGPPVDDPCYALESCSMAVFCSKVPRPEKTL